MTDRTATPLRARGRPADVPIGWRIGATSFLCCAIVCGVLKAASAQSPLPVPTERVTFRQAIDRAIDRNPTVAGAAAGILRAEGLLRQARAATSPQLTGNVVTTTLNRGVEFSGTTVTPQNQVTAALSADMPIVAAAAWARRGQAAENRDVAVLNVAEVRRQVALATADAYLSVIAQRRALDATVTARDVARAHFNLASQLEQQGSGSRLNSLRAQQEVSTDEALVEAASLAVYRSQEALGVLLVADDAVDVADEPVFDIPAGAEAVPSAALVQFRSDLKLFAGEQRAAERVLRDSSKDWWPSLDALFQPQTIYPSGFFLPSNSWRFLLQANIPIFDSGQRTGLRTERQASVDAARATLAGATTAAASQVRAARAAVLSNERSLASIRESAAQAQQVVSITTVAFRAGAATNIEVIDAERSARNADIAVAVAEDNLRRARFDLLDALGRFP